MKPLYSKETARDYIGAANAMNRLPPAIDNPAIVEVECFHCRKITRVTQLTLQSKEAKRWEYKYKNVTLFIDEKIKEGVREKLSELSTMTLAELLKFSEKIKGEG